MTHKIRGVRVEEYAYYIKKIRQNVVWKHEYDVKLWCHKQRTQNTNNHHMPLNETPLWKFSAYATKRDRHLHKCRAYPSGSKKRKKSKGAKMRVDEIAAKSRNIQVTILQWRWRPAETFLRNL